MATRSYAAWSKSCFGDKRQAIEISQRIDQDISAYLITISVMNAAGVLATAVVMWLCG